MFDMPPSAGWGYSNALSHILLRMTMVHSIRWIPYGGIQKLVGHSMLGMKLLPKVYAFWRSMVDLAHQAV